MDNMDGVFVWVRRMRDAPVCSLAALLSGPSHRLLYTTTSSSHAGGKVGSNNAAPAASCLPSREAGLDARHDAMHGPGLIALDSDGVWTPCAGEGRARSIRLSIPASLSVRP